MIGTLSGRGTGANRLTWIAVFITLAHFPKTSASMPNPQLTDDQAAAVVSHILSLKERD